MKSRYVSLRKNPAGSPENKEISYPGKGTRFSKHLFISYLKIEYTLWYRNHQDYGGEAGIQCPTFSLLL